MLPYLAFPVALRSRLSIASPLVPSPTWPGNSAAAHPMTSSALDRRFSESKAGWRGHFLRLLLLCSFAVTAIAVFRLAFHHSLSSSTASSLVSTPAQSLLLTPPPVSPLGAVSSCASDRECSGSSNGALIDNMVRRGLISSPIIAEAMKRVDRAHYITRADTASQRPSPSTSSHSLAYVDSPQYLGYGATISAPHMHAMCTELMLPALQRPSVGQEERRVLDVGSGSGYLAAVLSRVLGEGGRVYGVEHVKELVDVSLKNLEADDPQLLTRVHITQGDGSDGQSGISRGLLRTASPLTPSMLECVVCVGGWGCRMQPRSMRSTWELRLPRCRQR